MSPYPAHATRPSSRVREACRTPRNRYRCQRWGALSTPCQCQLKTAHFWQLKTAHTFGEDVGSGIDGLRVCRRAARTSRWSGGIRSGGRRCWSCASRTARWRSCRPGCAIRSRRRYRSGTDRASRSARFATSVRSSTRFYHRRSTRTQEMEMGRQRDLLEAAGAGMADVRYTIYA